MTNSLPFSDTLGILLFVRALRETEHGFFDVLYTEKETGGVQEVRVSVLDSELRGVGDGLSLGWSFRASRLLERRLAEAFLGRIKLLSDKDAFLVLSGHPKAESWRNVKNLTTEFVVWVRYRVAR